MDVTPPCEEIRSVELFLRPWCAVDVEVACALDYRKVY
jgi:hypothetical protein